MTLRPVNINPCRGALARCSLGALGLILSGKKQPVTYYDGSVGEAYVGIHLTEVVAPVGSPWSSRNPKVLGIMDERVVEAIVAQVAVMME